MQLLPGPDGVPGGGVFAGRRQRQGALHGQREAFDRPRFQLVARRRHHHPWSRGRSRRSDPTTGLYRQLYRPGAANAQASTDYISNLITIYIIDLIQFYIHSLLLLL